MFAMFIDQYFIREQFHLQITIFTNIKSNRMLISRQLIKN